MKCSKCLQDAIIFQPYSGLHLCGQHIIADVEAKAKKVIRAHGWLKSGDHIAVLLSVDQNSSALLYFLKKLTAQRSDIRITALIINDKKITSSNTLRSKHIAECLDTEFLEVSLSEESNSRAGTLTAKNPEISSLPMFPPSDSILPEGIAQKHGITKIAWGLCLDDAAGVVLDHIIRGEGETLVRDSSFGDAIIRICPFIAVTAAEVSMYAELCGYSNEMTINPEPGDGLHKDVNDMLDRYTNNHPATKYALLNLGENLMGLTTGIAGLIFACECYGKCQQGGCNDGSISIEVTNGAR